MRWLSTAIIIIIIIIMTTQSTTNSLSLLLFQDELRIAKQAVRTACRLTQAVRHELLLDPASSSSSSSSSSSAATKADQSPVTVADYGAQAVICAALQQHFATDAVVAEEEASALRDDDPAMLAHVTAHVRHARQDDDNDDDDSITDAVVLDWIQHGSSNVDTSTTQNRFWTLDPIDGTKGFLRGDQYAVCLALVQNGQVCVGVLGCPALEYYYGGITGHLVFAVRGQGCWIEALQQQNEYTTPTPRRVHVNPESRCMVQSWEASHGNHAA